MQRGRLVHSRAGHNQTCLISRRTPVRTSGGPALFRAHGHRKRPNGRRFEGRHPGGDPGRDNRRFAPRGEESARASDPTWRGKRKRLGKVLRSAER